MGGNEIFEKGLDFYQSLFQSPDVSIVELVEQFYKLRGIEFQYKDKTQFKDHAPEDAAIGMLRASLPEIGKRFFMTSYNMTFALEELDVLLKIAKKYEPENKEVKQCEEAFDKKFAMMVSQELVTMSHIIVLLYHFLGKQDRTTVH
jgi:hypothetical protein